MTRLPLPPFLLLAAAFLPAQMALETSPVGMMVGWGGFVLTIGLLHRYRAAHPFARFGPANGVTLMRACLACLLFGLLIPPMPASAQWVAAPLGGIALLADGIDGWLARRSGLASTFGARFDMETDAALILALALLAAHLTPAGPWIAFSGALRYLFVAAMVPWPWLAAALPTRPGRRLQCVIQAGTLVLALVPGWPALGCQWIAGIGLVTALWSFTIDIIWLYRHRRSAP